MLRTALLALIFLVSLTSSSIIKKSLSRRQSDPQHCQVIDGFDCKCSYYRVTCTTDRNLPTPITIVQNEKHKYQSVELVVTPAVNVEVNEHTFEPVKELYKPDGDNFEFRIKFEKFTALHLSSPGIFNRVFPENLPSGARKHLALEIYNTEVQPNDNVNLFQNLNADSLELYALYPFRGTFQQLFNGANIKYVRLSGGDIRSDASQPFTGTVGRLELAKQANTLSVQNFPVYPAHELVISAFYVSDFNAEHPPNYGNLAELRVQSPERIPANAFRHFPNLKILSLESEKDIDPHALDGLDNLEKLTVKSPNSASTLELLKNAPKVKEFETNIEKLDENTQCQLIEKLASGQVAVQTIPNGRECTCVSAYLDSATGRAPCNAEHCEHSSCAAIKNNYDASTRSFKTPPSIRRADGSDALHQRESRTHSGPFQISQQDQEKLHRGTPQQQQQQQQQQQPPEYDSRRPNEGEQDPRQPDQPHYSPDNQGREGQDGNREGGGGESLSRTDGEENPQEGEGNENQPNRQGNENQSDGQGGQTDGVGTNPNINDASSNNTETATPPKKGMSWLPIIIIAASIAVLLIIGLIIIFIRKRGSKYDRAATNEPGQPATRT